MQLYENIEGFWKLKQGNRLMFSSFGYNAQRHAEIVTQKVSLLNGDDQTHVLECRSSISSRQEPSCTEFTLKFLSSTGTVLEH
jgi:hypothetical protein